MTKNKIIYQYVAKYGINNKKVLFNAAFSLVEMLMALLVASLLLAALAPVMTKRMSGENVNVIGGGGAGSAPPGMKCWNWEAKNLNEENQRVVSDYPFDDIWYLNFIIVSGGGGGAGATLSSDVDDSFDTNNEGSSVDGLEITKDMDEFDIDFITGGGGGGGGGAAKQMENSCTGAISDSKCECLGHFYDANNNVCVSQNNGNKNFSGASSACSKLLPASKWRVPTTTQLSKWTKETRDALIVKNGDTVWSRNKVADENSCTATKTITVYDCYKCVLKGTATTYYTDASPCNASSCSANGGTCSWVYSETNWSRSCPSACTKAGVTCTTSTEEVCSKYSTYYYHFYKLSGTNWLSVTNVTTATDLRSTYCVYADAGTVDLGIFYSISGSGGGAAPSIVKNGLNPMIRDILNSKIKDNIGGHIVLQKGLGGSGGSGASVKNQKAGDGNNGEPSCIVVKSKEGVTKFKLCVAGGVKGVAADGNLGDNGTPGIALEPIPAGDACYIQYGENDSAKQFFSCSTTGNKGTSGTYLANNIATEGYGGASVSDMSIMAQYLDVNGSTLDSSKYPGAGGGAGRAKNVSSAISIGDGGNGSDGYIKLSFKHKFDGAGGGGGGGGSLAVINNVFVGKNAKCSFKIGHGGSGGSSSDDGLNGGSSSVICSNEDTFYEVYGGEGGKTGISANSAGEVSIGGKGGKFGGHNSTIAVLLSKKNATVIDGTDGMSGGIDSVNYIQGQKSAGGSGGTSGTSKEGKCGALLTNVKCSASDEITLSDLNAQSFSYIDIVEPNYQHITSQNPKFGEAGAGGGGGAWHSGIGSGDGGDGLGGYVCVYWQGGNNN